MIKDFHEYSNKLQINTRIAGIEYSSTTVKHDNLALILFFN